MIYGTCRTQPSHAATGPLQVASSVRANGLNGDWWAWVETDHGPRSPSLAESRRKRMPWIKCDVSSKDSLALRTGDNDGLLKRMLLATQRPGSALPISFYTDLAGKQRQVKESSKNPHNPFFQIRNPLPLGFGLENQYNQTPAACQDKASGWILDPEPAATPRQSKSVLPAKAVDQTPRCTGDGAKIVKKLVAMDVDDGLARRAVQVSGCRTVAVAMQWILDNEPDAVGDLERLWRQRTFQVVAPCISSTRIVEHQTAIDPSTQTAHKRRLAAGRFLAGSSSPRTNMGAVVGLRKGVVGVGHEGASAKGTVEGLSALRGRSPRSNSDAGSIRIFLDVSPPASRGPAGASTRWVPGQSGKKFMNPPRQPDITVTSQPDITVTIT